ncbi:hypothetical protein ACFLST_01005 [Chloroflexota bacterium]
MIAFNSKYLSDVLGVLREERVALGVTSSSSPGVLRPVGVDNYVHVVMPMFDCAILFSILLQKVE